MLIQLYSVFDQKTRVFCKPFYAENDQTALRSFTYAANDPTQDVGRWPEDYSLYHLGAFDDHECVVTSGDKPTHLANALTLVTPRE